MTDDEELASLNAGDDAELAKLNGATSALEAKPAPEKSIWEKGADYFGLSKPSDQSAGNLLMAAQNGATAGLAPKINAAGEYGLKSLAHGIAPETFPDSPSWKDTLAKNQGLYGQASEAHPVVDVAGSFALPVPKGTGIIGKGLNMGGASVLQSAARQYGASPENDPAKAIKPEQLAVSGGLGFLLGGLGGAGEKLAQRGEEKTANAIARNSDKFDATAETANRSAGRGIAEQKNAIFTTLDKARAAAADATLPFEERLANEKWLASDEARKLALNASQLNRERAGGLMSALARANAERDDVAAKYAPDMLAKMKQEALDKPQMRGGLLEIAKRIAPAAGGYALDKALGGGGAIGGGLGLVAGAMSGQPGRILRNRMATPAFQQSLGTAMQVGGDTAARALSSPATPRAASTLAEYLNMMHDEKDEPK